MTKRSRKIKDKNTMRDALTNKRIGNKEVICIDNAVDWVKKQGFIVSKPSMEKLREVTFVLLFAFISIMMMSLSSAITSYNYDPISKTAHIYNNNISIMDWQLIENTDLCLTNCYAIFNVTIKNDSNIAISFIFKDREGKDATQTRKIHGFDTSQQKTIWELKNITDYELYYNGTAWRYRQNGSHIENVSSKIWEKVNINPAFFKKLDKSVILRLDGIKEINENVDFIPVINDVPIVEMAWWNASISSGLYNGLVYWFSMNESSGTNALDNVASLNATYDGSPTLNINGKIGTAMQTDGTTGKDMRKYTYVGGGNNQFSIVLWFNSTSLTTDQYFVVVGNQVNPSRAVRMSNTNNAISMRGVDTGTCDNYGSYAISQGVWHFLVYNYNGTASTLYVDGYNQAFQCTDTGNLPNNINITFGSWFSGTLGHKGLIDEVGIWNRTLNSTEITSLYNSGAGTYYYKDVIPTIVTYPSFYNISVNPISNSSFIENRTYYFNVTIINVTSGGLNLDGVNKSMSNISSMFYTTALNLSVGNHSYYFYAYNGSYFNQTQIYTYVVRNMTSTPAQEPQITNTRIFTFDFSTTQNIYIFVLMIALSVAVMVFLSWNVGSIFLFICGFIALLNYSNLWLGVIIIIGAVICIFAKKE